MLIHLSRYKYIIQNWYYRHSFNLNAKTSISGSCKQNLWIRFIYMLSRKILTIWWMLLHQSSLEYVMGNWYYCRSINSNVKTSIAGKYNGHCCIILYECVVQWRSQVHGKCLSRYKYVIVNWYCSRSFNSNVNTNISGSYKDTVTIIFYIYAAQ